RQRGTAAGAGRVSRLRRDADRVPGGLDRVELAAAVGEQVLGGLQGPGPVLQVRAGRGLHQHRVVQNLDRILDADAVDRGTVAGRAGGLAVGRVGALGQQVEPVVAGTCRRVYLGVGDRRRVAVRVTLLGRVVHDPDRTAADQVDPFADGEVR